VVERVLLEEIGIQDFRPAVDSAIRHGCTPDFVLSLVEVYCSKPGAWDPGGLRDRILKAFPQQDPSAHWLPERKAFKDRERRHAEAQSRRQCDADAAARIEARRAETAAQREQLARFSADELLPLVDGLHEIARPAARKILAENGPLGLVGTAVARPLLLAAAAAVEMALDPNRALPVPVEAPAEASSPPARERVPPRSREEQLAILEEMALAPEGRPSASDSPQQEGPQKC
jgi:hypothetical protein